MKYSLTFPFYPSLKCNSFQDSMQIILSFRILAVGSKTPMEARSHTWSSPLHNMASCLDINHKYILLTVCKMKWFWYATEAFSRSPILIVEFYCLESLPSWVIVINEYSFGLHFMRHLIIPQMVFTSIYIFSSSLCFYFIFRYNYSF